MVKRIVFICLYFAPKTLKTYQSLKTHLWPSNHNSHVTSTYPVTTNNQRTWYRVSSFCNSSHLRPIIIATVMRGQIVPLVNISVSPNRNVVRAPRFKLGPVLISTVSHPWQPRVLKFINSNSKRKYIKTIIVTICRIYIFFNWYN